AGALKLAKSNEADLLDAMNGEHYENTKMYKEFAAQARQDGDEAAAKLFEQIASDEGDHYEAYKAALKQLQTESK
ncbi:MAG: rubrerythrin, partial [Alphaproteobacteria bacterium]|nr:rubrerythrin [Alphaproteobacteria bacterium]